MTAILSKLKDETIEAIPVIIYFLITFNLINLTERLMLRAIEPGFGSYLLATTGALLAGKLLIIVNTFPFLNAFPTKPMIYNILWKFFIYGIATLIFRLLDILAHFFLDYTGGLTVGQYILFRLTSSIFWAIEIWLLMLFFVYIVAHEFMQVMGKKNVMKMLFG